MPSAYEEDHIKISFEINFRWYVVPYVCKAARQLTNDSEQFRQKTLITFRNHSQSVIQMLNSSVI